MFHQKCLKVSSALVVWLGAVVSASAQLTVTGITDKTPYNDSVTFTIVTQAGFSYSAFLNTNPVPAGVAVTVNRPDYYELRVTRTDNATSAVVNSLTRFLVNDSSRADTEWGLPPQTPWPVIQSSSNEFAGAQLRLVAPQDFPASYPIPVVAWVEDASGHAVRANGLLAAGGHPSIQIKRGVGSGFLASNLPPGIVNYAPTVGGLATNKTINIESATPWTTVSGVLGNTTWAPGSRIQVTGNLTVPSAVTLAIGAGTIVRLNASIDITNNGSVVINGTVDQPVVFMPTIRTQPWGGFISKTTSAGTITGNGVIFTGSGANSTWFGSGGNPSSHRKEQALFYCDGGQQINLTDSAAIFLAGQLSHSRQSAVVTSFTFTRFLMQRTTSGGEFTGARFTINDSAFIECPDDSSNFVDGDNDALYFVDGTHNFTNTLFGWTKDDGIDSGGDGVGRLNYEQCWFEATFHEGNSLSGLKNTTAHGTVYLDCGQGIEDGYGAGSGGPTGRVDTCLFAVCQAGVRHGDNYPSIGNGYPGIVTATNCLLLYNHRDVFGYNWRSTGWTNAVGQMFINHNLLTVADTNFPNNAVWNPGADASRLIQFGAQGHVGVALATRTGQTSFASFPDGVPIGLSMFCTNTVSVDYTIDGSDGTSSRGTLQFAPGELRKFIALPGSVTGVLRIALANPTNADLTGTSELLFQNLPGPGSTALIPFHSPWRYLDDGSNQGTAWRAPGFNDTGWSNGVAELGFGDGDETTVIRRTNNLTAGNSIITFYFRKIITASDPSQFASVRLTLKRDDGAVVYINGAEIFRSTNMPGGTISYTTLAIGAAAENNIDITNLSPTVLQVGANVVAVEMHQQAASSSDLSFDLELLGLPPPPPVLVNISRLGGEPVIYWSDGTFTLEQSPEPGNGTWTPAGNTSPVPINPSDLRRFFRLRKP